MNNFLIFLMFLMIGCSSEAQQKDEKSNKKAIIKNGILVSYDGINLSKYEIEVETFDVEKLTLNHFLCLFAEECDEDLLKQLIEKGVDVNFKCEDEDDFIIDVAFCKENGVALAKLLLSEGANINGTDQDNDSFLSYAIGFDNLKLVKYLIENGADKNQRDINRNMGCLPIHGVKTVKMLELLIGNGFQVNEPCDNGRSLLHFAAKENLKEIAIYLLEKKLVNFAQKDKNGETALDYSKRFNHPEIAEVINKKQ